MIQILYKSIYGQSKIIEYHEDSGNIDDLYKLFADNEGIPASSFKLYLNGKMFSETKMLVENYSAGSLVPMSIHPLLVGGKGGFGSMLRAIGAQIEKTTNKEACRDLSGRRLRDINAEKKFKEWASKKGKEDEEKEKKRKEKLERMKHTPKIMFEDPEYFKNKEEIPQEVDDALEQGLKKAAQSSDKRKSEDGDDLSIKKQKKSLWLGIDLSEDESDLDDDQDNTENGSKVISTSDSEKDDGSSRSTMFSNMGPSTSSENSQQTCDSDQVIVSTKERQISVNSA